MCNVYCSTYGSLSIVRDNPFHNSLQFFIVYFRFQWIHTFIYIALAQADFYVKFNLRPPCFLPFFDWRSSSLPNEGFKKINPSLSFNLIFLYLKKSVLMGTFQNRTLNWENQKIYWIEQKNNRILPILSKNGKTAKKAQFLCSISVIYWNFLI